jgi:hypothetical protein
MREHKGVSETLAGLAEKTILQDALNPDSPLLHSTMDIASRGHATEQLHNAKSRIFYCLSARGVLQSGEE